MDWWLSLSATSITISLSKIFHAHLLPWIRDRAHSKTKLSKDDPEPCDFLKTNSYESSSQRFFFCFYKRTRRRPPSKNIPIAKDEPQDTMMRHLRVDRPQHANAPATWKQLSPSAATTKTSNPEKNKSVTFFVIAETAGSRLFRV